MKRALLLGMMLVAGNVLACGKGCEEHQGVCACDQTPERAPEISSSAVSDEKPSRHPQPAWQRGEVNAATPPSVAAQDALQDEARMKADAEGKKAAGIQ